MLKDEEIEKLLELAEEKGYRGFAKGKFYIRGRATASDQTLLKNLDFPAGLDVDGLHRLQAKFKDLKNQIVETLEQMPYTSAAVNSESSGLVTSEEQSAEQIGYINDNICLYKTIRIDSTIDPGAKRRGGLSILAFNTATRTIINGNKISIDGIMALRGVMRDTVATDENVPHVWPVFNPYTPDLTFKTKDKILGKREVLALNTAIPAPWMLNKDKGARPELTGFIKKLIMHLFPYEKDRESVLDWCHYAIFKRNGTVLCLAGDRGTGKSTFIEIMGQMVGEVYSEIVNEAILKEKFNAQFLNKRLVVFEEVALSDDSAINKVKAWCNNKISIEEKGNDAFSAENYSSMVFLLNKLTDLKIQPQERRFSIPVVATENLLTVFSEEEIDTFKKGVASGSKEILRDLTNFGLFLKERKPTVSEQIPIRGPNFNKVADLSMTEWQAHLREYVANNGVDKKILPIVDIFPIPKSTDREALKFPMKKATIEEFLRDYRYQGKYKIGDIQEVDAGKLAEEQANLKPHQQKTRSRRTYGIVPRADFLEAVAAEKRKATKKKIRKIDLL